MFCSGICAYALAPTQHNPTDSAIVRIVIIGHTLNERYVGLQGRQARAITVELYRSSCDLIIQQVVIGPFINMNVYDRNNKIMMLKWRSFVRSFCE